jgi:hypothetical protein
MLEELAPEAIVLRLVELTAGSDHLFRPSRSKTVCIAKLLPFGPPTGNRIVLRVQEWPPYFSERLTY